MLDLGTFRFSPNQRERFRSGELWREWAEQYPMLFDAHDRHLAIGQAHMGYHFYEWLAAILLHHSTGYHALVGKYQFPKHTRKREIARALLSEEAQATLHDVVEHGHTQGPDLLMYSPDHSEFFFCEVKGPNDSVSATQQVLFEALASATGREVGVLWFRCIPEAILVRCPQ